MEDVRNQIMRVKDIAEIMEQYGLNHVKIESNDLKYELSTEGNPTRSNILNKVQETQTEHIMESPLVGIFYRQKTPAEDPFIEVGDIVRKGDTICLIEAMKMFTEVVADFDGKITEIFVKDGDIVEFSQPLFKYAPHTKVRDE